LTDKKDELKQEEERGNMDPAQQRESLMAKIKSDNANVEQVRKNMNIKSTPDD